ncbi:MAG: mannitol dehydrogenase family protein [Bacteroidales bacterium]|jgi:mannitol 2-dehydrogenase|nr:mannitol dehydrogenase family protein [Bacteroidales bacterium]
MKRVIKLNAKNLSLLPKEVAIPAYDRSKIKTGIVHIGIGGFHRAHQAFYTDQVLHRNSVKDWGICGIALLAGDRKIFDTLSDQDGLYTLMTTEPDGTLTARVIGSVVEYLFAPDNTSAVLGKIADPDIKIITLTITEGGYNFNAATGDFLNDEPSIQWDLKNPKNPKTVFGYLTQALKLRRDRGIAGLTIQSCDNIQKNGDTTRKMLLAYIKEAEPGLIDWIEKNITFPNSMVDRITPVTTPSDIDNLKSAYGIEDKWPVVCEPFIQWVIEDIYTNGRPEWEYVGVQFVTDVGPYERMKISLLNAGHSLLGLPGALHGYSYIHEVVHDQLFAIFLCDFMDKEVTPILDEVPGINLDAYKKSLIERFGNSQIKDKVARICHQSSAKIPKFLLPTIMEQLKAGGPVNRSALVIAAWCRYSEGIDEVGNKYQVDDEMKEILQEKALLSHKDHLAFLRIESIFGDLINSGRFTDTYIDALLSLYNKGVINCIKDINIK